MEPLNMEQVGEVVFDQERTQLLRIRVKLIDDRVFDVEAEQGFSVLEFRDKVAQVTEIPVHLQRLIYRGKLLKDGTLLSNYDIQDGHTVHLVAKRVMPPSSPSTTEQTTFSSEFLSNGENTYLDQGLHRSRARLRQLLRSTNEAMNTLNNPSTLRSPSVLRPPVTTRNRFPDLGELSGDALNLALLRDALDRNSRVDSNTDTNTSSESSTHPLPNLRGGFREDEQQQMAQHDVPAGVTLNDGNLDHIVQGIMMVQTVLSTASHNTSADHTEESGQRRFFIGQWLDVQDTVNQWLESTVMDIANGKVLIHYHGWPSRWDEWLDMDSNRIAAFRTRTTHVLNPQQLSPSPTTRLPNAPHVQGQSIQQVVPQIRDLMRQVLPQLERLAELCDSHTAQTNEEESSREVDDELSEMAHLISPVLDRFGRLLTDSARQLDPLLRSELQREQRNRRQTVRSVSGPPLQVEQSDENSSLRSMRDLILTSTPPSADPTSPPRRNIDVHIHAIISPSSVSSLASLARLGSVIAGAVGAQSGSNNQTSVAADILGSPMGRPLQSGTEGRSLLNDYPDFDSLSGTTSTVDDSRIPLLSDFHTSEAYGTVSGHTRPTTLNNYMSDDIFGTSFSQDSDNLDDPIDGGRANEDLVDEDIVESRRYQRILSPQSIIPNLEDDEVITDSPSIGIIPEIAESEQHDRQQRDDSTNTSASSSSPFPTLLQVLRRTLSDVRGFIHSSRANDENVNEHSHDTSSSVISSTTSPRSSRNISASNSSIEEDFDSVD